MIIIFCTGLSFFSCGQETKETVFYNGTIFTADTGKLFVEAVAIRNDKIIKAGDKRDVFKSVGKHAKMVDLQGNCLLPGLIDTHIHVLGGGQTMVSAHLEDEFRSFAFLRRFAEESFQSGKSVFGKYIMITGLNQRYFYHPDSLSAIFDKGIYDSLPVYLRGAYGHTAWINKVLIAEQGIDAVFLKNLPGSEKSFYEFSPAFSPNGILHEQPVFDLFSMIQSQAGEKNTEAALAGIRYCNSLGITAMLDPRYQDPSAYYKRVADNNQLTAHMNVCLRVDPQADPDSQIRRVDSLRREYAGTPDLTILGIKVFADGAAEMPAQTAALSRPYLNSGSKGDLLFNTADFAKMARAADSAGMVVHVHAIGDRAVTETLNGFEQGLQTGSKNRIHHSIAHLQFVNPDDFERFTNMGILASFSFYWAQADTDYTNLVKPYIVPELYSWQYPAYSMMKKGVVVTGGSDWPVSTPDPFKAMYTGETRRGDMDIVLDEDEKMPRLNLLFAYTRDAAKILGMEKMIGTIAPGKQADFVLVDRDVTSVTPEELKNTSVIWTMFRGRIIYEGPEKGNTPF